MIFNSVENWKSTGVILIDLQEAFDTLDHKILSDKMNCIYFSENNKMVSLSSDKQSFFVSSDNAFSKAETRNCGVPQHKDLY